MTTKAHKAKITDLLRLYCQGFTSQNKAANSLKNVSSAVVSQALNGNWNLISDQMWTNIGKQVGYFSDEWQVVETYNYKLFTDLLADAKNRSRVHAITAGAGWGKNAAMERFQANNENVYLINCAEYFNNKYLMVELLRAMGKNTDGTVPTLVERAVKYLTQTVRPLIIFNEFDKLKDEAFYFFITIYNQCEDKCGIVVMSTDQLEKRINRGLFLNKKGYQEIFSRFGRRFIEAKKPTKKDVAMICIANGVEDQEIIAEIYNSSEGDLRRVKKLVDNERDNQNQQPGEAA